MIPFLKLIDIKKNFGGIRAVDGLSLSLPSGSICGLVGPNGAGKTTLLNVITGFTRLDNGRIFFRKKEITGISSHKIAQIGIGRTFQEIRLIHQVSVLDNMLLASSKKKDDNLLTALLRPAVAIDTTRYYDKIFDLLSLIGLEEKISTLTGDLSYGQQKLLSIACCLATEPKVLLLDEPVSGIHPKVADKILDILEKLRDESKLIIFVEHDLLAVQKIADQVIVMDEGKIVIQGPPKEILKSSEIMEVFFA